MLTRVLALRTVPGVLRAAVRWSSHGGHKAVEPAFAARVASEIERQGMAQATGMKLVSVTPGVCEMSAPFSKAVAQQHGFFHGGFIATLADNAAGFAAISLASAKQAPLAAQFNIHYLAPADGDLLTCVAKVVKPGRTLTVSSFDVYVHKNGHSRRCATGTHTTAIIAADRADVAKHTAWQGDMETAGAGRGGAEAGAGAGAAPEHR